MIQTIVTAIIVVAVWTDTISVIIIAINVAGILVKHATTIIPAQSAYLIDMVLTVNIHVICVKTVLVIKHQVLVVAMDIILQALDVDHAQKTVRHVMRSGLALNANLDIMIPIAKLPAHCVKTELVTNKTANAHLDA